MAHMIHSLWQNARPALLGAGGVVGFILVAAAFVSGLANSLASV